MNDVNLDRFVVIVFRPLDMFPFWFWFGFQLGLQLAFWFQLWFRTGFRFRVGIWFGDPLSHVLFLFLNNSHSMCSFCFFPCGFFLSGLQCQLFLAAFVQTCGCHSSSRHH